MKIQILISTMNKETIKELDLIKKNIKIPSIIINQTNNNNIIENKDSIMLNFKEKGISKSRNRALENANADICIISDDDVEYIEGFDEIINELFENNKDIDIITYKIVTSDGTNFKKYLDKEFIHDKRTILKVSSIEIAFRLESIKRKNIKFDESFGLGAEYISGEENIFLKDCINSGLKIKYIPVVIAKHEAISSGKILNKTSIYSKGALFYRLFGYKCFLLNTIFIFKKLKNIKFSKLKALNLIYKGTLDYINKVDN